MNEKIEDFKFSNWEDYAKTLEAENEKLRDGILKIKGLCDGNRTDENNIWYVANRLLNPKK